jgi:hypothetical protein
MLAQLFPRALDADYRGSRSALWVFGFVVTIKSLQSLMSLFNGHAILMTADGIPVDTYAPVAAQTVIALFALIGAARLPFYALCALALARYRSAVPLLFTLMIADYLVRSAALFYLPVERTGSAGGLIVNRVLFAVMLVGLWLSLRTRRSGATQ